MGRAVKYHLIAILFWPLLFLGIGALLRLAGAPWPPILLYMAVVMPVLSVARMLSWPGWAREQARLDTLPPKIARAVVLDPGRFSWKSLLVAGASMAILGSMVVMERRGYPHVLNVAVPTAFWLILIWLVGPATMRDRFQALRRVAQIPICAECGYQLQSPGQSCSECGWSDDGRPSRPWRRWQWGALILVLIGGAALPIAVNVAVPSAVRDAKSMAMRRVADELSIVGPDLIPLGRPRTGAPDLRGHRIVSGWLGAREGARPAFGHWEVLVGEHMQPLAWEITEGGRVIASYRPEMLAGSGRASAQQPAAR